MRDPLVPLDFGGWLRRVYGVFRRNFAGLATLALVPAGISALYRIVLNVVRKPLAETNRRYWAAIDALPPEASDAAVRRAAFGAVFGPYIPYVAFFGVLILLVSGLYQGSAYYLVLRRANGRPASSTRCSRPSHG
jgi:hypothetical protein